MYLPLTITWDSRGGGGGRCSPPSLRHRLASSDPVPQSISLSGCHQLPLRTSHQFLLFSLLCPIFPSLQTPIFIRVQNSISIFSLYLNTLALRLLLMFSLLPIPNPLHLYPLHLLGIAQTWALPNFESSFGCCSSLLRARRITHEVQLVLPMCVS